MSEAQLLKHIGKKIKAARIGREMTQDDLAMQCGFEKARLSRIENGLSNPTLRSLYKISVALEIPITDLFCE